MLQLRPEPGFEPGTEDPQSHMLPGYTTRAIMICCSGMGMEKKYLILFVKNVY